MIKVLFVCHGNICRSPMAEYVMRDKLKRQGLAKEILVSSAATSAEEIWEGVGNPVYPAARRKLAEHGITCEGHQARQMTREDYRRYDYLVGMDGENLRGMRRIAGGDPEKKLSLLLDYTDRPGNVADPWYTGDFDAAWRDIDEGTDGLLTALCTGQVTK